MHIYKLILENQQIQPVVDENWSRRLRKMETERQQDETRLAAAQRETDRVIAEIFGQPAQEQDNGAGEKTTR